MSLPDPKTLDYAYLKTGAFADYEAKAAVTTQTLDYAHFQDGAFVGYPYGASAPAAALTFSFGLIIGAIALKKKINIIPLFLIFFSFIFCGYEFIDSEKTLSGDTRYRYKDESGEVFILSQKREPRQDEIAGAINARENQKKEKERKEREASPC